MVDMLYDIVLTFSTAMSPILAVLVTPCAMAILTQMILGIVPENAKNRESLTDMRSVADTALTFVFIFVALYFGNKLEEEVGFSKSKSMSIIPSCESVKLSESVVR